VQALWSFSRPAWCRLEAFLPLELRRFASSLERNDARMSLTASSWEGEDGSEVGVGRGARFFLGVGALIGLVLGILVSVTTDVPLAPEAGVLLGALVGWLFGRVSA
jgi:hypothetical protein